MIKNVKCCRCGTVGYNPNVPKNQVIDTCTRPECLKASQTLYKGLLYPGVIGFINGNIRDCRRENLYHVHGNIFLSSTIDDSLLTSEEINLNDQLALAKHFFYEQMYQECFEIINKPEFDNNADAQYYLGSYYLKKANNIVTCLKYLRKAVGLNHPIAKAEYGYIITKGLYKEPQDEIKGLNYLIESAKENTIEAGVYLADLYLVNYVPNDEFEISLLELYQYIKLGLNHPSPEVRVALAHMLISELQDVLPDEDAMEYLRYASNLESVEATEVLIKLLFQEF